MTLSISCRLCFSSGLTFKCLIDDNGQFNNIYEIAVKYFKLELSKSQEELSSAVICQKCWNHINEFYIFQQLIRSTQSQIKKCCPIIRIYHLQHKLNNVFAPTQTLNLPSSTLDQEKSAICTNKVDISESTTAIHIQNYSNVEFKPTSLMQSNNVAEVIPSSVDTVSNNTDLTSKEDTEKESKQIVKRYRIYAEIEGFQCDKCHAKFNYTLQLKHHLKRNHNISLKSRDIDYRCAKCKHLTFSCFDNLKRHMRRKHHVFFFLKKYKKSCNEHTSIDEKSRCEICKQATFSNFVNLKKRHTKKTPHLVYFSNKNMKFKKSQASKESDASCPPLVPITTSLKQSVHLKPNENAKLLPFVNYSITKSTEKQSVLVTNVDKDTANVLMEDISINLHRTNPPDPKCVAIMTNNNRHLQLSCDNEQFQPFHSTISSQKNENPEIVDKNIGGFNSTFPVTEYAAEQMNHLDDTTEDANVVVDEKNRKYNSTMKKTTDIQSVKRFKGKIKLDRKFRCEFCKHLTFCNFSNLKRHMNRKHQIVNFRNKYKKSYKIQAGKEYDTLCSPLVPTISSQKNEHPEMVNANIGGLNSTFPVTEYTSEKRNHLDDPTENANVVVNVADEKNRKYNSTMQKATDIQSVERLKRKIKLDRKFRCEFCKYSTFCSFFNLKRHMNKQHQIVNFRNKRKKSYKIQASKDYDAPHQTFKPLTTLIEESGHLKINEDAKLMPIGNYLIIKATEKPSPPDINVDKDTAKVLIEDTRINLHRTNPPDPKCVTTITNKNRSLQLTCDNEQFQPFHLTISSHSNENPEIVNKNISCLNSPIPVTEYASEQISNLTNPTEVANVVVNILDEKNKKFNSTVKKATDIQSIERFKGEKKLGRKFRCEFCKHLTFCNFANLKRHMNRKHQIVNFCNKYKKNYKIQASKDYDDPHQTFMPLTTLIDQSGHVKHNENSKLVSVSNTDIINRTENQAILTVNPIANVDKVSSEDKRKTIQQEDPSEVDKVDFVPTISYKRNIKLSSNKEQHQIFNSTTSSLQNENSATITKLTTDLLKSPISVKQTNRLEHRDDAEVVANIVDINKKCNSTMIKTNENQLLEPLKIKIKMDKTILNPLTTKEFEDYRCEKCKHLKFSSFRDLKRHLKQKHPTVNFRNKYNKSKKKASSKNYVVQFQPLTTSLQADHGNNNEDAELLANKLPINKMFNYNLRNKNHKMDNCVKAYKKCETQAGDDVDAQLQLTASTNYNNIIIEKYQKQKVIQPKNHVQVKNLKKNLQVELNTIKKKTSKPKITFLPDTDNFIRMSIGDLKCLICERTFGYYSLLNEHFKLTHPSKKCFVNCCENDVINRWDLVQHLKRYHVPRMANDYKMNKKCNNIGEEAKDGSKIYSTTSRSYISSDIIQADPVLAITSVISAHPVNSLSGASLDQPSAYSTPSTSSSSRATTMSKTPLKKCNYCSRTFKYVTALIKHINNFHTAMRNDSNSNQKTNNRNFYIKSENDALNTSLNLEDNTELNEFQEIKTEISYDILATRNISVPPLDIVDIKEDINFE